LCLVIHNKLMTKAQVGNANAKCCSVGWDPALCNFQSTHHQHGLGFAASGRQMSTADLKGQFRWQVFHPWT